MARLPIVQNLGERPTPRPGSNIISYRGSTGSEEAPGLANVRLGQTLEHEGDELYRAYKVQEHKTNTTRAEDAFNELRKGALDLTVGPDKGFVHQKGAAAVNKPLYKEYGAQFETLSKGISEGLANDDQRTMFQQRATVAALQFKEDMIRHITREADGYAKEVYAGTLATEQANAGARWQDIPAVALSLERSRAAIETEAARSGWAQEYKQAELLKTQSKIHETVIGQALASNNYVWAEKYFELNKEQIDPRTGAVVQKAVEDGVQKQLASTYQTAFIESRSNLAGLEALDAAIAKDPRLDDQRKNILSGRVASRIEVLERRDMVTADRALKQLGTEIDRADQMILQGYPPTIEQLMPLAQAAKGTALETRVTQTVALANETSHFMTLAPVQRDARIALLEGQVRKDPTRYDANVVNKLRSINESMSREAKDNPVGFMISKGFVTEGAPGAGMIDLSKPEAIGTELAGRYSIARAARDREQVDFKPLMPEEVTILQRAMSTMNWESKRSYLGNLARSSGQDKEGYKAIMQQLAPDDPVSALAGIRAHQGLTSTDGQLVADMMLRGQGYLNPPKDKDGKPVKSTLPLPPDATLLADFNTEVGNAFRDKPGARNIFFQSARAIWADMLVKKGDYSGTSTDGWKEAIKMATGGLQDVNGQMVVLPFGMSSGDFKDGVRLRLDAMTPKLPNGLTVRDLWGLPMQNDGDGTYIIRSGDAALRDTDGNVIVIDFNKPAGQPSTLPVRPQRQARVGFSDTPGGAPTGVQLTPRTQDVTGQPTNTPASRAELHRANIKVIEDEIKKAKTPKAKAALQDTLKEEQANLSKLGA